MPKCKITVLRRMFIEDLANEYCANPQICSAFKDGQEYLLDKPQKPADFCGSAWDSISNYVFAFIYGAESLYGNWMKDKNTMIACCNDGVRPVIFKIEKV